MASPTYPEHDKLGKIVEKSQAIGEFIEWLRYVKKLHLASWMDVEYTDTTLFGKEEKIIRNELHIQPVDINNILAEYFDIDQKKLEEEKRAMLDGIRKKQGNELT